MTIDDYRDSPIFWLRRAWLAMRRAIDDELHTYDLTGAQFEVLRQLWTEDQLELRLLQERIGVTSPTLTGIVDGLVGRCLVERRISADDARVKHVCLTSQGQALNQEISTAIERAHRRLLAGFSAAEATLLKDWLRRIVANIGVVGDGCG